LRARARWDDDDAAEVRKATRRTSSEEEVTQQHVGRKVELERAGWMER